MSRRTPTDFRVEQSGQDMSAGTACTARHRSRSLEAYRPLHRLLRRRGPAPHRRQSGSLRRIAARRGRRAVSAERRRRLTRALRGMIGVAMLWALPSRCALQSAPQPGTPEAGRTPAPSQASREPSTRPLDPQEVQRLQRLVTPLIRAMDHPRPLNQVKVGILDDARINAASAGGGEFYVTTGLLRKANDLQLAGVLAHELAHDDLGHVAKAQARAGVEHRRGHPRSDHSRQRRVDADRRWLDRPSLQPQRGVRRRPSWRRYPQAGRVSRGDDGDHAEVARPDRRHRRVVGSLRRTRPRLIASKRFVTFTDACLPSAGRTQACPE